MLRARTTGQQYVIGTQTLGETVNMLQLDNVRAWGDDFGMTVILR